MNFFWDALLLLWDYRVPSQYLFGGSHQSCSLGCCGIHWRAPVAGPLLQTLGLQLCWRGRLWCGYFLCGFCEISGGTFSTEHLQKTASVFYSKVLKINLGILIFCWLLVSCVFWQYASPRGCTAWGLMGGFYFVFIILTVDGTGKILIKVWHRVETN